MLENDGYYPTLTCDYCGKEFDNIDSIASWFYRSYENKFNGYVSDSSENEAGDFCSKKCENRYYNKIYHNKTSKYSFDTEFNTCVFADNQKDVQRILNHYISISGPMA